MLKLLTNFLCSTPFSNLFNRLINKYSAAGITLIMAELVKLNVLPNNIVEQFDGLPATQLSLYVSIAVGLWLIWHFPFVSLTYFHKSELQKKQNLLALTKVDLEIAQLNQQIKVVNSQIPKQTG